MYPRPTYQQGFDPDLLGSGDRRLGAPVHQPRRFDVTNDPHNLFVSDQRLEETISISKGVDDSTWMCGEHILYLDTSQTVQVIVKVGEEFQVKIQDCFITCKRTSFGNAVTEILVTAGGVANTMQLKKSSVLGKMLRVLKLTPL